MCGCQPQPPNSFLGALDVEERRQNGQQRVARTILEHHPAAHKFGRITATGAERPVQSRGLSFDELEEVYGGRTHLIPQSVALPPGHHHEIALGQMKRCGHSIHL